MNPSDAEEYTQALGQVTSGAWRQVALGVRLGVPQALGLSTPEWVQERLGGYVRLGLAERREAVQELTAPEEEGGMGLSQRKAGEVLGVGQATVSADRNRSKAKPSGVPDQGEQGQADRNRSMPASQEPGEMSDSQASNRLLYPQLMTKLMKVRKALRDIATDEAQIDDEARELLSGCLQKVRQLLALVELRIEGGTHIDWDAELLKLGDE